MKFYVLTLFPEMIEQCLANSITGRAMEQGKIALEAVNIRDYTLDKHKKVDDYPSPADLRCLSCGNRENRTSVSGDLYDPAGQDLQAGNGEGLCGI